MPYRTLIVALTLLTACGSGDRGRPPVPVATDLLTGDSTRPADPGSPQRVPVRFVEGTIHGFLRIGDSSGRAVGQGELLQSVDDSLLQSRMVLRFNDSSYLDERVAFTQRGGFRMLRYHMVQRGAAFERDLEASLDGAGNYQVESIDHAGKRQKFVGTMELPADTYNGMPITIIKNLTAGSHRIIHVVAFTPKPRLVGLEIDGVATTPTVIGEVQEATTRFTLHPTLGGITGVLARLLGKLPPDSHAWIVSDQLPAFVRFEGPLYSGSVWRLEMIGPPVLAPRSGR